jgi:mannonate dehydratase
MEVFKAVLTCRSSRAASSFLSRRAFWKIATAAVSTAELWTSERSIRAESQTRTPGIKLGLAAPASPTQDDLLFYRQLGVDCVFCPVTPELNSAEGLRKIRSRYAEAGIPVHNIRNLGVTNNQVDIILNRSRRDQKIEEYKDWLRTLSRAGFSYTLSNFNLAQIVTTSFSETRGSRTRVFDVNGPEMGIPADVAGGLNLMGSAASLYFGREYSRDEIRDNYTYFIKQVAPVAEEVGFLSVCTRTILRCHRCSAFRVFSPTSRTAIRP